MVWSSSWDISLLLPWTWTKTCTIGSLGSQALILKILGPLSLHNHMCRFLIINLSLSEPLRVQLTLEQYRFEVNGSIYTWIFFNSKYYNTTSSEGSWILKWRTSDTEESWTWKNSGVYAGTPYTEGRPYALMRFSTVWRVSSPNPHIVQGSTVLESLLRVYFKYFHYRKDIVMMWCVWWRY